MSRRIPRRDHAARRLDADLEYRYTFELPLIAVGVASGFTPAAAALGAERLMIELRREQARVPGDLVSLYLARMHGVG